MKKKIYLKAETNQILKMIWYALNHQNCNIEVGSGAVEFSVTLEDGELLPAEVVTEIAEISTERIECLKISDAEEEEAKVKEDLTTMNVEPNFEDNFNNNELASKILASISLSPKYENDLKDILLSMHKIKSPKNLTWKIVESAVGRHIVPYSRNAISQEIKRVFSYMQVVVFFRDLVELINQNFNTDEVVKKLKEKGKIPRDKHKKVVSQEEKDDTSNSSMPEEIEKAFDEKAAEIDEKIAPKPVSREEKIIRSAAGLINYAIDSPMALYPFLKTFLNENGEGIEEDEIDSLFKVLAQKDINLDAPEHFGANKVMVTARLRALLRKLGIPDDVNLTDFLKKLQTAIFKES